MEKLSPSSLEDRLLEFSISVVKLSNKLPHNKFATWLADQMSRSGGSSSMHYGEVRSAESPKDFRHKMKVCLKELRECYIGLRMTRRLADELGIKTSDADAVICENNELISIFVTSIRTAEKNAKSL